MPNFVFKNVNSEDMGIEISAMPSRVFPTKKITVYDIDGRDGELTEDLGGYEAYTIQISCAIQNKEKIDVIGEWLEGSGELWLSTDAEKVYDARVSNAISISDLTNIYNDFILKFRCQPFRYSRSPDNDFLTLTSGSVIYPQGNYHSLPIITIYADGDVTLTINDDDFTLQSVDGYVTVNSEVEEVYKGSESQNMNLEGVAFPRFEMIETSISWTGDITKVEIEPRWRWK